MVLKHCDFDGFLRLLPFYGSLFRITFTSRNFSLLFFEFLRVNFWKEFSNFLRKCTRSLSVKYPSVLRIRMTDKNCENPRDMICPEFHVIWSEFESHPIFKRNGYHGSSPYTMGMTAVGTWKFNHPVGFGIHQVKLVGTACKALPCRSIYV